MQRAVLDLLATDPAGPMVWGGAPAFAGVTAIAAAVFGTDAPTSAQVGSVRRAVRSLERAGLVETWRGPTGRAYSQRRWAMRVLVYACRGDGCPWCVVIGRGGHHEHPPSQMSIEAIGDRLGTSTPAANAELDLAARHGVHWWFGRPGPDLTRTCQVAVVELAARRALTPEEHHADQQTFNAFISRRTGRERGGEGVDT